MASESERQQLIRQRAYAIWEKEGWPEGQHDRHWQQASEEIESALGNKAPAKKTKAKQPAAAKAAPQPGPKSTAKSAPKANPTSAPKSAQKDTTREAPVNGATKPSPKRKPASS